MGNQYKIKLGKNEYYIDLLFYHRYLQCMIAVELKAGKFEPAHAAQLNYYLEVLDDTVKQPHENPSIGILLCAEKDHLERSEEHTSELQSLMRISYAVFCLKKKNTTQ